MTFRFLRKLLKNEVHLVILLKNPLRTSRRHKAPLYKNESLKDDEENKCWGTRGTLKYSLNFISSKQVVHTVRR